MSTSRTDGVHILTITIDDIEPPIWRRMRVPSSTTLARLHQHIQTAFGWWDYHLHLFEIRDTTYGVNDGEDWGRPIKDEAAVTLADVATVGASFIYTYDLGDNWNHTIAVEAVEDGSPEEIPSCLDGARSRPPEDCGGPHGYEHLLEVLQDPKHDKHEHLSEWAGLDFDPEFFDTRAVNAAFEAWTRATVQAERHR